MPNGSVTHHGSPVSNAAYQGQYEPPTGTYAIRAPRPVALDSPLYQTSAELGTAVAALRFRATPPGICLWTGLPPSISSYAGPANLRCDTTLFGTKGGILM